MDGILEEALEDGVHKLEASIGSTNETEDEFFDHNPFMKSRTYSPIDDSEGCKIILYQEVWNLNIRAWDLLIFIPNLIFVVFLLTRFRSAQRKLNATNSLVFRAFYGLVLVSSLVSVLRCVVSMSMSVATSAAGDVADKILWIFLRFCLLITEMSVVVFGIATGHLDSRNSIKRVVVISTVISLAFSLTQAVLEINSPDPNFYVESKDYYLFGHGGMLFWLVCSQVFALVYFIILILPFLHTTLSLPQKRSFYYYIAFLFVLNALQTLGSILVYCNSLGSGLCIVNFTTYIYFTLFTPIIYFTFLGQFFKTTQPTLLFSYKAQVDDMEDELSQQSLHHRSGINPEPDNNSSIVIGSSLTGFSNE